MYYIKVICLLPVPEDCCKGSERRFYTAGAQAEEDGIGFKIDASKRPPLNR